VHEAAHRLYVEALMVARLPNPMRDGHYRGVKAERGDEALSDLVLVVAAVKHREGL
jgi:hypothetical protein